MGGWEAYWHGRRAFFSVLVALAGLLVLPASTGAYTFGPTVTGLGPEETVFDWSAAPPSGACETWDIPDQPARAIRNDQGQVQLYYTAFPARANTGADLNTASTLGHHDCTVREGSTQDSNPAHFDDFSWLASPYTLDGHTIYSLDHQEYRGWLYGCPIPGGDTTVCWYNSVNLATSTNSGGLFTHTAAPTQLIATVPDQWVDGTGPYGTFQPSNIIAKGGYYYSLVRWKNPGEFDTSCVMRTSSLTDPLSWRGWGGSSFNVRFINPYLETPANLADHLCAETKPLGGGTESLTYNTYFGKYMLVSGYGGASPGFYYSLSDDLVHWTDLQLMIARETQQSFVCGDPDPVRDPSVLDPASTSRNFDTAGRDVYVYYKIFRLQGGCAFGPDRDLIRIPIRLTGTVPVASFTASPSTGLMGNSITLDASASSDPGGNPITNYRWDLDGDGSYDTASTTPVKTVSPSQFGTGTVTLTVTDSEGLQDIYVKHLNIDGKLNMQPTSVPTPSTYVKETGSAYDDAQGYGWVRQDSLGNATHTPLALGNNTIDRDRADTDSYSQQLDTLMFMQYPAGGSRKKVDTTPGAWEMTVPCGLYTVTVSVGDSRYRPNSHDPGDFSTNQINIEGQTAISGFQPTSTTRFKTATRTVPVCDRRLTIDAVGGTNTKLNYIEVSHADPAKANFQPDAEPVPDGYAKDIGAAYSDTRGFGWVRQDSLSSATHVALNMTPNTHDRDHTDTDSYDQRQDTLIFMQYPQNGFILSAVRTPGAWEMALPCGTYDVTVSVGDSRYRPNSTDPGDSSVNTINIEGVNAIAGFTPTSATRFMTATRTVTVCDGRLTIDAIGGTNTKLNYVDVTPVTPGP